jgi:glycerol-3-phosphate dehydrogenase
VHIIHLHHVGSRKLLPPTRTLDLAGDPAGIALKPGLFWTGCAFSDCRGDDACLVVLNARDGADHGAVIRLGPKS